MSERGSFVTEYIHCSKCLSSAKAVLLGNDKYLCSTTIPTWDGTGAELPIIAGKIGGLYAGEELDTFDIYLADELSKVLCHPLRVAVLAEQGGRIFTVNPC